MKLACFNQQSHPISHLDFLEPGESTWCIFSSYFYTVWNVFWHMSIQNVPSGSIDSSSSIQVIRLTWLVELDWPSPSCSCVIKYSMHYFLFQSVIQILNTKSKIENSRVFLFLTVFFCSWEITYISNMFWHFGLKIWLPPEKFSSSLWNNKMLACFSYPICVTICSCWGWGRCQSVTTSSICGLDEQIFKVTNGSCLFSLQEWMVGAYE